MGGSFVDFEMRQEKGRYSMKRRAQIKQFVII
jgi:hypothetical protein